MNNPDDLAAFHRREMDRPKSYGAGLLILCIVAWMLLGVAFGIGYVFGKGWQC